MSRNGHALFVGRFEMRGGVRFEAHHHPVHQLAWSEQGILAVTIGERTWVLPSTRALWIPAGLVHVTAASSPATMLSAYFARRSVIRWKEPTVIAMSPLARELVRFLASAPKPAAAIHARKLLFAILAPLSVSTVSAPCPEDPRARRVADALLANPADPRELAALGKKAGASARTLARLFVTETGMTFGEWRTRVRIRVALEALANGASVTEVAARVGYQRVSAFGAAFRRQTGTTPSRYFAEDFSSRGESRVRGLSARGTSPRTGSGSSRRSS
jgi:AraC-like DNA-binding protein